MIYIHCFVVHNLFLVVYKLFLTLALQTLSVNFRNAIHRKERDKRDFMFNRSNKNPVFTFLINLLFTDGPVIGKEIFFVLKIVDRDV